jgi:hypothetical protein
LNAQPAGITSSRTKSSPEGSAYPFRASGARRNTGLYYDPTFLVILARTYLYIIERETKRRCSLRSRLRAKRKRKSQTLRKKLLFRNSLTMWQCILKEWRRFSCIHGRCGCTLYSGKIVLTLHLRHVSALARHSKVCFRILGTPF